jgi:hypothetical protein
LELDVQRGGEGLALREWPAVECHAVVHLIEVE